MTLLFVKKKISSFNCSLTLFSKKVMYFNCRQIFSVLLTLNTTIKIAIHAPKKGKQKFNSICFNFHEVKPFNRQDISIKSISVSVFFNRYNMAGDKWYNCCYFQRHLSNFKHRKELSCINSEFEMNGDRDPFMGRLERDEWTRASPKISMCSIETLVECVVWLAANNLAWAFP